MHKPRDAVDGVMDRPQHLWPEHGSGGLDDGMAHAMPDEDFNCDLGVILNLIGQVHDSAGNPVGDFVRVGRVYFLNHGINSFA